MYELILPPIQKLRAQTVSTKWILKPCPTILAEKAAKGMHSNEKKLIFCWEFLFGFLTADDSNTSHSPVSIEIPSPYVLSNAISAAEPL